MKRKRLCDSNVLGGQTETITMMHLRESPGDIIEQVQMGKVFTITKAGKVVAVLSKPEPNAFELAADVRRLGLVR